MMETIIRLKPREQWRDGLTTEMLVEELDAALRIPGLGNVWVQPIRNRIDMLATGIKSPVGIKIGGPDLEQIERIGMLIEQALRTVPGTASAFSERVSGGRYIEVRPDRLALARLGLNIEDVQRIVGVAIGGENVTETVEGLARFPVNLRYPRELRDSLDDLRNLPIVTERGETITLGGVATVAIADGPPMIKTENARPNGWVYVDIRSRDLGSYVREAQEVVREKVTLPPGYSLTWSGQYEYLERATQRMSVVVPATLVIIYFLLFLTFRNGGEALLIMASLPFALIGGFWLLYALGHNVSVELIRCVRQVVIEFPVLLLFRAAVPMRNEDARLFDELGTILRDLGLDPVNVVADIDAIRHGLLVRVLLHEIAAKKADGLRRRRGRQPDDESVEIIEHLPPEVVDRAVALVHNDEVKGLDGQLRVVDDRLRLSEQRHLGLEE